jgi:uncharacterized membrane protein YhaH (DUF805 family)
MQYLLCATMVLRRTPRMYEYEPFQGNQTLFGRLFKGRLNVRSFLLGNLSFFGTLAVLVWLANSQTRYDSGASGIAWLVLVVVVWLCNVFYSISFAIRRLHDHGRNGWWMLLMYVPVVGLLMVIYLLFPGDKYDNEYGPVTQGRLSVRDILGLPNA